MIRLLIVARPAVVRAGLEALAAANPGLRVVGAFADFAGIEGVAADVVLAAAEPDEIPSPPGNGVLPVVLLTGGAHPVWTPQALRLGVRGMLPGGASQAEILAAVEAAASGLAAIDPRDLETLLVSAARTPAAGASARLTAREIEVLRLMADGEPNKVIAWKLGISEHTAKFHAASILAKLGAASRAEAVAIGMRTGLVLL